MHPWRWSPIKLKKMLSDLGQGAQFEIETEIETFRGPIYEFEVSTDPKVREFTVILKWYCRKAWRFDQFASRVVRWEKVTPCFGGDHCTMRFDYRWYYFQRKNDTRGNRIKVMTRREADGHIRGSEEPCRFFSSDDPTNIYLSDNGYTASVITI